MDAGISNIQRSQSWLSNIGPTHRDTDIASSPVPQMQDAFLSPLSNKGIYLIKEQAVVLLEFCLGKDRVPKHLKDTASYFGQCPEELAIKHLPV